VAGRPTRRGSLTTSERPAPAEAISIARLRAAGAVFLGKTTTPEFAWKGLTNSPLNGVTVNPLDHALSPGGSSGGAAAATALGLGIIGIGLTPQDRGAFRLRFAARLDTSRPSERSRSIRILRHFHNSRMLGPSPEPSPMPRLRLQ
jgi:hypothetical protein